MRYYYYTKSYDRIGNRSNTLWVSDRYPTKAALRRALSGGFYGKVFEVLTEAQVIEKFGEDALARFEENAKRH